MDSNINYIPQIDYTSKDYTSIREDLLALIPSFAPKWTSRDPSDMGMVMVELFSYMGDLMSFYTDRAANEGFMATASQRASVVKLANLLGYVPTSVTPAQVSLTFSNTTASPVVIPAYTQVATTTVVNGLSTQIIFETTAEVTVPAKSGGTNGTIAVTASQGASVFDVQVGTSTGAPSQVYKLADRGVIASSVAVTIGGVSYRSVASLLDANLYDAVFSVTTDASNNVYINFGDGVKGAVPPAASAIYVSYTVGDGNNGNVPAGTVTSIISPGIAGGVTVTNPLAAAGGSDEESTDSIRVNAPKSLRALSRAVSLKDYASLAVQVPGVSKANAIGTAASAVTLYISPFGSPEAAVVGGTPTDLFVALANKVSTYFTSKTAPNVTLTILPPTYVTVDLQMTIHVLPQYRQSVVTSSVLAAVRGLLSENSTFFADVIPVQHLLNTTNSVQGLDYATIELLRLSSNDQTYSLSSWARTSNIATVTTSATHNITVGQTVSVTGVDAAVNGTHVVTGVTSTTISFGNVGGNVGSTALSPAGSVTALVVETITCGSGEIPVAGNITISAIGGVQ